MTIQLFDTAQRAVVPFEVGPGRAHVRVRHHALRLDPPRPRRHLPHLRPPHPPARGARPRGAHGAQRHRRRRLDPPEGPRARRALPRARRGRAGPLPLRHGGARHAPAGRRATRHRVDRRHDRHGRPASSTTATRTSRTAPSTSTSRRSRASASCRTTRATHMVRLARARGGNPDDPHRRDPLDFVLWQPSLPDEPAWRAPFGVGRPGWHVECSVMAMHELGPTIDLHGGGTDLIFPHHECEVAQSESVTGEPFSRHWVHSAMVSYEGEKMSKSLGNLVFVSDLLKVGRSARHPPRAHAPPLPRRLRVARHRPRRGHRAAAPARSPPPSGPTAPTRVPSRRASAPRSTTTSTRRRALEALDDLAERGPVRRRRPDRARRAPRARRAARHRPRPAARRASDSAETAEQARRRPLVSSAAHATITITLPDGSTREHDGGVTAGEIAASIGRGLAKAALGGARSTASGTTSTARSTTTPASRSSPPTPTTAVRCCATPPRT